MRYKLTIEYDGTGYVGWQKQPDQADKSIEEILEKAILKVTQTQVKLTCSGRTDAGVHALAQIVDFALDKKFDCFGMMMGINNNLYASGIVVLNCEIVDDHFSSRFNAKMRHYRYIIVNRRAQLALQRNRAWHVPVSLDLDKMREAALYLIGKHDFSSFRDSQCQSNSATRVVSNIAINKLDEQIFIDISAKSFLHHMVRNIVGTLALVGSKKIAASEMKNILEKKDRRASGPNAPASGLYFLGVDY